MSDWYWNNGRPANGPDRKDANEKLGKVGDAIADLASSAVEVIVSSGEAATPVLVERATGAVTLIGSCAEAVLSAID